MTNRERIIKTALCEDTDRPPFISAFGPWGETVERWRAEGLGPDVGWDDGCGFDAGFRTVGLNLGYLPQFKPELIEDREHTQVVVDWQGIKCEVRKGGSSIPRYIEYPIKCRGDWERVREERLDPDDPGRFPPDWDEVAKGLNAGDHAVQIGSYPYGVFGWMRDLMGLEGLLFGLHDDPGLIREMMGYLTGFWIRIYEKVCRDVRVDCLHIWEDMSGKQGSLISPAMFREFMTPQYERLSGFARTHGIPIVSVDTDGNCDELVPLFMEGGVNMVFPFEVAAGSDVLEFRRRYPKLCIMGGIDKRAVALGREAIDAELGRIRPMFSMNGYIASMDHLIHPEISLDSFRYYVDGLRKAVFGG
ncbi:MAG: hypothetical protein FWE70_06385 [Oscillospiraceae bacterium]|nr:hypothetical protein [Oscillospiraceae bacterium]